MDNYSILGNREQGILLISRDAELNDSHKKLVITGVKLIDKKGNSAAEFSQADKVKMQIDFKVLQKGSGYNVGFELWSYRHDCIFTSKLFDTELEKLYSSIWEPGTYSFVINIPSYLLKNGNYFITAAAAIPLVEILDIFPGEVGFTYNDFESPLFKSGEGRNGVIIPMLDWQAIN